MNIYVRQIYTKPGVRFPFSIPWQQWVSKRLSTLADASPAFCTVYGSDFNLVFNISAQTGILDNDVKGPTVFRQDKDVEYTIFLPFDVIRSSETGCMKAMQYVVAGVRTVLKDLEIDTTRLNAGETDIIRHCCSDPAMLETPWP
jgi:hypothetical protein